MRILFPSRPQESWVKIRARMLSETERFIEEGLKGTEKHPRIPAIPVGSGSFTRGLAEVFWAQVLGSS